MLNPHSLISIQNRNILIHKLLRVILREVVRLEDTINDALIKDLIGSFYSIRKLFRTITKDELTLSQMNVVRELVSDNGLTLKELSARLKVSHSSVSGIVDRLEQRGILERRQDINDKRYIRIHVSDNIISNIHNIMLEKCEALIKIINTTDEEKKRKISEGLTLLCEVLEEAQNKEE